MVVWILVLAFIFYAVMGLEIVIEGDNSLRMSILAALWPLLLVLYFIYSSIRKIFKVRY